MATNSRASPSVSAWSAQDIYEAKQRAVKFYNENGVPSKLEDILNAMFHENPPDVYGRLSEYFETLSKPPTISKITAREVLDSKGQPTVQVDIYCIVKGVEQFIASSTVATFNNLPDNAPLEKKELDDKERQDGVNAALSHIQTNLSYTLYNVDPCQQQLIDDLILEVAKRLKQEQDERQREEQEKAAAAAEITPSNNTLTSLKEAASAKSISPKGKKKLNSAKSGVVIPEEPKEELLIGSSAVCALSQAVLLTGACVKKCQPFEYISSLNSVKATESWEIPIPMINIMNSGKAAAGKQNIIRELLLIPKPGLPLYTGLKQVLNIYNQVGKLLVAKQGSLLGFNEPPKTLQRIGSRMSVGSRLGAPSRLGAGRGSISATSGSNQTSASFVNDMGGYSPPVDRPEQLLDTVQEAITNVGMTVGEDIFFGINCAAHEVFDMDKAKYEITTGVLKTCDDMVEFYADIINRYPAIVALIDPIRKHEIEGWNKLYERISERCFIIGDSVYPRPERLVQEGVGELRSSAVALKLQRLTTITDFLHAAQVVKDDEALVVVSDVSGAASDPLLADLAVAVCAKLVKFGAPSRGERVIQYNRLLQISEMLQKQGKLATTSDAFNFPIRKPSESEHLGQD